MNRSLKHDHKAIFKIDFINSSFFRFIFCSCFAIIMFIFIGNNTFAMESTTYTYTQAAGENRVIRTLDAYIPGGIYLSEIGLSSPEDLFLHEGKLYIADTGNGRIVVYTLKSGEIEYLGDDILTSPTGISVGGDGKIYVADYGASEIVVLSKEGEKISAIGKPEDLIYGASPYKPKKVEVDSFGNIFAISEGTNEGILQFTSDGSFSGFFGANKTQNLTLTQWFQKIFYSEEQKSKMLYLTPPNIVTIDVADSNLIYSVTQNDSSDGIKKLNLAGVNVFERSGQIFGENNWTDTAVSKDGNVFVVTDTGSISEFDNNGNYIFGFGGRVSSSERNGLTSVVSAIEVDDDCSLYVLDKERGVIQTYYPTDYADLIHQAYIEYNGGYYEESLNLFEDLLEMNPNSYIANLGYGNALFQMTKYSEASSHFMKIYRGDLYSNCYWEMRSSWLRENMESILLFLATLIVIYFSLHFIRKKYDYLVPVKNGYVILKQKRPIVKHLITDGGYLIKHPIDGYYDLKHGKRGSILGASVLYILAFVVYMCSILLTSVIFTNYGFDYRTDPLMIAFWIIFPLALFVVGSYLISSINDGEGSFKNSYIAFGYMLSPYILFTPFLILASNYMTYTEQFIYSFSNFLIVGYTALLLFLGIKETHCYSVKKTITNILLTIFFMIIAIIALAILYILWREIFGFIVELFEEVSYRVKN